MIEIKTILSEQLMKKFHTAQTKRTMWVPTLVALVLITAGIVGLFVKSLGAVFGVPVILLGIAVPVAYMLITRYLIGSMAKKAEKIKSGTSQSVRFADDCVLINEGSAYTTGQDVRYAYDEIEKVAEREEAFYMTVGGKAYMMDAKGFRMGARNELHWLLVDKLGKRFTYTRRLYAKK